MLFNPDRTQGFVGFHLPPDQLARLDQVRIELRLSRSELMRQVITAHLQRLQTAARKPTALARHGL
ncbi:ribbon-helix-helix protein, CopG family [Bradyrhizobium sp. McL0616]|uniref:ribbon-helix-helix protein, CopG family n=1 Tax=Bradyrhizobium sp. McL0616 TaxID=3415674 RepID=UPI003CF6BC4A